VRSKLSTATELAGIGLIAVGLGMLAPWLGVTAGGVALLGLSILAGLADDSPAERREQ